MATSIEQGRVTCREQMLLDALRALPDEQSRYIYDLVIRLSKITPRRLFLAYRNPDILTRS